MFTQVQPLRGLKTQASLGDGHAPLHAGESASPQEIFRHSHDPVPTAARQVEPAAHDPLH
jgi:hypothetical protein